MQLAVTRQVSPSIVDCELTYLTREPIDVARARRQHAQYEAALRDLGVAVLSLPEEPDLPDSVFVEDTALVLNECAIILRPGAASRRAETESIARILAPFRKLLHIQAPARLDGGDILRVRQHIYVGLTRRSDTNSIEQMQEMLVPFGYDVRPVQITGCLHLKSAVTEAAQDVLLLNPNWVDRGAFESVKIVEIDPSEPHAANVLRINETAIYDGAAFPRTRARLDLLGIRIVVLEADELAKAEGALTCCSLILSI